MNKISQNSLKRKLLFRCCIAFVIVFFYLCNTSSYLLFVPSVLGNRVVAIYAKGSAFGGWASGEEAVIYIKKYILNTRILNKNYAPWLYCDKPNEGFKFRLDLDKLPTPMNGFYYMLEDNGSSYKVYALLENHLLFISGFPDMGGAKPAQSKKEICEL